jgi:cytochrome c551/c552
MKLILIISIFVSLKADSYNALLFNGNCTTCHEIDKTVSAPSMKEVQRVYKQAFPDKKDFVEYMSTWAQHPNKDGSLMLNAIDKHGLMPELGFDKSTLEDITDYIYELK